MLDVISDCNIEGFGDENQWFVLSLVLFIRATEALLGTAIDIPASCAQSWAVPRLMLARFPCLFLKKQHRKICSFVAPHFLVAEGDQLHFDRLRAFPYWQTVCGS